jgi:hypothetical protein
MSLFAWGRDLEDAFDERQRTRLSSIIFRRSTVNEKKHVTFEPVPDEVSAAATSTDNGDDSVTEEPIELTKTLTRHTPNEIRYAEIHGQHSRQERPTISVDEDLCTSALRLQFSVRHHLTDSHSPPCSQSWPHRSVTWICRASRRSLCSMSRPPTRTGAALPLHTVVRLEPSLLVDVSLSLKKEFRTPSTPSSGAGPRCPGSSCVSGYVFAVRAHWLIQRVSAHRSSAPRASSAFPTSLSRTATASAVSARSKAFMASSSLPATETRPSTLSPSSCRGSHSSSGSPTRNSLKHALSTSWPLPETRPTSSRTTSCGQCPPLSDHGGGCGASWSKSSTAAFGQSASPMPCRACPASPPTDVHSPCDRVVFPDESDEEADEATIHVGVVAHI